MASQILYLGWLLRPHPPSHPTQSHPMLDYAKMILLKVSFSRTLFEKELRKALKLLQPLEIGEFRRWCYAQFSRLYRRVLKRVFRQVAVA